MSENKTPATQTGTLDETIYVGRRATRSGSFCQPERLTPCVNLPKRSQSFRSCLKKPTTTISVPEPDSGQSSRRSSGSKAVMFTDEIGDNLEEVKKYDEAEPISIPEDVINKLNKAEEDVDTEKEDTFNNVENVRYLEESALTELRESNMNMKIFGNPRIRKSQSFNQGMRTIKADKSPETPKNSPLESVNTTPICSPVMVHKIHKTPPVELYHKKSIEKSQSFCSTLSTIPDESFSESSNRPRMKRLSLPQPQIVLTSPLDSPKVEGGANLSSQSDDKSRHFNASIEKLSHKLLEDGIETYLAIQHYVDTSDYVGAGHQHQGPRRSSSSSSCSSLPPPPSSAPPPLPSL